MWIYKKHHGVRDSTNYYFHCGPLKQWYNEINKTENHAEERLKASEGIFILEQWKKWDYTYPILHEF